MSMPADAAPIEIDRLFAAIGELYFQVRELRAIVVRQQQATNVVEKSEQVNGKVEASSVDH